jgi:hypothetical protein
MEESGPRYGGDVGKSIDKWIQALIGGDTVHVTEGISLPLPIDLFLLID